MQKKYVFLLWAVIVVAGVYYGANQTSDNSEPKWKIIDVSQVPNIIRDTIAHLNFSQTMPLIINLTGKPNPDIALEVKINNYVFFSDKIYKIKYNSKMFTIKQEWYNLPIILYENKMYLSISNPAQNSKGIEKLRYVEL